MLARAFPSSLKAQVEDVESQIPVATFPTKESTIGTIKISGEEIYIPTRVYFPEPKLASFKSPVQERIFLCIYTRHYDGYIREKYLKKLIEGGVTEIWEVPYIIQLVGESVVEIVDVVASIEESLTRFPFLDVIAENEPFLELTRQRVSSYWNVYYRHLYPKIEDYPGFRLLNRLGRTGR
jgi:hypothetical protein